MMWFMEFSWKKNRTKLVKIDHIFPNTLLIFMQLIVDTYRPIIWVTASCYIAYILQHFHKVK